MSQRRPYRLGKRQATVDETLRRIIDAAAAEYGKNGIEETTMAAVARRADVAAGTVLYHYPNPEALADAVVERWIEDADFPKVPQVPSDASLEERVDLLLDTSYAMFEEVFKSARPAAETYWRSPRHPAMEKLQNFWDNQVSQAISDALGNHVTDEDEPMISAILERPFRSSLIRHGVHEEQIQHFVSRLIVAWLRSAS